MLTLLVLVLALHLLLQLLAHSGRVVACALLPSRVPRAWRAPHMCGAGGSRVGSSTGGDTRLGSCVGRSRLGGQVLRRRAVRENEHRKSAPARVALPIDPLLPVLVERLEQDRAVVLQAPPGAGKTTRVPLALLEAEWLRGQRILVLEPRRLAATAAARRMAQELGEQVGERVGYRVRLDSKVSASTQVEVLTDGLFLRQLLRDPELTGVGCVIFDEFHERGADSDISLAFVLELREFRPELALIVMSATLAAQRVVELLGDAPLLRSEGRAFPVEVRYLPQQFNEDLIQHVQRAVLQVLSETEMDVLVFLPGVAEIRKTQQALSAATPREVIVTPLYGDLPLDEQEAAIRSAPAGCRKVVLATAIAESSLTIEGVAAVVDSGLARRNRFDPRRCMNELVTEDASQASAEQRCGRAGRLRPGLCVRLWAEAEQKRKPAFDPPELVRCDMTPIALMLASWGTADPVDLRLLDPIDSDLLGQGRELLRWMGALDAKNASTSHGESMAKLGAHPRLAHMLIRASERELGTVGARLAAILSERDPLNRQQVGSDLVLRLKWLEERGGDSRLRDKFLDLAEELGRQAGITVHRAALCDQELKAVGELVAMAYPDRVAIAVQDGTRFLMPTGRSAILSKGDELASCSALAVAEADGRDTGARILTAAKITPKQIRDCFADELELRRTARWDKSTNRVKGIEELRLGALVLESKSCAEVEPLAARDILIKRLQEQQLRPLPWGKRSQALQQRLALMHRHRPDQWPDRSEAWLLTHLEDWLGDQLLGLSSFAQLSGVQLEEGLWQGIPRERRQELERLLPSAWPLPSGRAVAIDYGKPDGTPVLAGKLQEFFGCRESPAVLDGKLPLLIHLLSPAGSPLQITHDLAGFWEGSYAAVRKSTRGRYPRHPWPEDPRDALPTAKTKHALAKDQENHT